MRPIGEYHEALHAGMNPAHSPDAFRLLAEALDELGKARELLTDLVRRVDLHIAKEHPGSLPGTGQAHAYLGTPYPDPEKS